MKRYRKEAVLFVVVFAVAIIGLIQLFHQEAYAVGLCNNCTCYDYCSPYNHPCFSDACVCEYGGPTATCDYYCAGHCPPPPRD